MFFAGKPGLRAGRECAPRPGGAKRRRSPRLQRSTGRSGHLDAVREAAGDGADAVFVSCFGDPGVQAAREIVDIPVVGGFEPAVLTSLALGERTGVITVLPNVPPMLHGLVRRYALTGRVGTIRAVDVSVLDLDSGDRLIEGLTEQARAAVAAREADVIVLGCTGMLGVAAALQERLAAEGPFVPVVDPTGAAIMWLESQVRLGVRPSRTTYQPPRRKDRIACRLRPVRSARPSLPHPSGPHVPGVEPWPLTSTRSARTCPP
ncbi:aspartate/glutamate racemase family protein [Streptomyces sp. NPDC000351]|uniref:aspartate/glutamate racemase family protein n=1 Tax=Streptomyces sp. NPDC000351 TaxID=3154250 RepID=UPI003326C849